MEPVENIIREHQKKFDRAELSADKVALQQLLTEDFLSIGPKGFVLTKQEWIERHRRFKYLELDTSEVDVRLYDKTAIVRNVQRNKATHDGDHVEVAVRVMQVWVEQNGSWRLAGIQFSPLTSSG